MTDVIYKNKSYKIIRACLDVHNDLVAGFLEAVYQETLPLNLEIIVLHLNKKRVQKYKILVL